MGQLNTMDKVKLNKNGGKVILPHFYNYILKEEILNKLNSIDEQKVFNIKRELKERGLFLNTSLLVDKIIEEGN
ncbi:MAG: hypothetical protein NC817_02260 [Candidatus Omnitrophica bacterium]|nr:hypothetical protein [Candidatus Omnitrophota bacterium]MCM8824119.1 hypothetical protein [Candidatus Omnitrophota bacterium]MCM8827076.1 hypothetical protein [Candidatus Omnitrophota bacterium]